MNESEHDENSTAQEPQAWPPEGSRVRMGKPIVTYAVMGVCALICAYLNVTKGTPHYHKAFSTLVPSAVAIWSGAYWGLATAPFVHLEIWHILFNMLCANYFGSLLEPTMGKLRYLFFILCAGMVSAGAQLAFSNQTGIGFSGAIYGMFGYGLAGQHVDPGFRRVFNRQTCNWLLGWLAACMVMTWLDILAVANAAHVAGFVFGYCVGEPAFRRTYALPCRFVTACLVLLTVVSVTYVPWSPLWREREEVTRYLAIVAEAKDGDAEAQYIHGSMLLRTPDAKWEGIELIRKSAEQEYTPGMNALAWIMATDHSESVRNGPEAVKLAKRACEKDEWQSAAYIDTLAAAYAEVEQWEDAVTTQRLAMDKLTVAETGHMPGFEKRLQNYLNQKKTRE